MSAPAHPRGHREPTPKVDPLAEERPRQGHDEEGPGEVDCGRLGERQVGKGHEEAGQRRDETRGASRPGATGDGNGRAGCAGARGGERIRHDAGEGREEVAATRPRCPLRRTPRYFAAPSRMPMHDIPSSIQSTPRRLGREGAPLSRAADGKTPAPRPGTRSREASARSRSMPAIITDARTGPRGHEGEGVRPRAPRRVEPGEAPRAAAEQAARAARRRRPWPASRPRDRSCR